MVFPAVVLQTNLEIWRNALATALTTGIKTHNVILIFFSILQNSMFHKEWASEDQHPAMFSTLKFLYTQILDNFRTSDTFREGGNNVSLRLSIKNVWEMAETVVVKKEGQHSLNITTTNNILHDYPLPGTCVLLNVVKDQRFCNTTFETQKALHTRICRHIIGRYMGMILRDDKERTNTAALFRQNIINQLYECRYGVPIEGTGRLVSDVKSLLSPTDNQCLDNFITLNYTSHYNVNTIIHRPSLTLMLSALLEYKRHNSTSNVVLTMTTDPLLLQALLVPFEIDDATVVTRLNSIYVFPKTREDHSQRPEFVTLYGPSVLQCVCGYRFDQNGIESKTLMGVRRDHFREVYHTTTDWGMPGGRCSGYNLHRGVQMAYNPQLTDDENIQKIIEYIVTVDKRGNIHDMKMEKDIRAVLPSFKRCYQEALEHRSVFDMTEMTRICMDAKIHVERNLDSLLKK